MRVFLKQLFHFRNRVGAGHRLLSIVGCDVVKFGELNGFEILNAVFHNYSRLGIFLGEGLALIGDLLQSASSFE